jgi:hypothetical protein
VAQVDGFPQGNSYPTSQWTVGEIVSDAVTVDLSEIPPGSYLLATGFYNPKEDLPRLTVTNGTGVLPGNRVLLPDTITAP